MANRVTARRVGNGRRPGTVSRDSSAGWRKTPTKCTSARLSRYRAYNLCPVCHGSRLQPEALCWQWQGLTLPALYQLPVPRLAVAPRRRAGGRPGGDGRARWRRPQCVARLRVHPHASALPASGRAWLPDARPLLQNALRRRGPAGQPDVLPRYVSRRYALRAR